LVNGFFTHIGDVSGGVQWEQDDKVGFEWDEQTWATYFHKLLFRKGK
jgi:hypothetical protein